MWISSCVVAPRDVADHAKRRALGLEQRGAPVVLPALSITEHPLRAFPRRGNLTILATGEP
ncbi:hypothetical protein GCM10027601_05560 [Nocardioides ungokensis]